MLYALIVIYNKKCEDSITIKKIFPYKNQINIIVFDNSDENNENERFCNNNNIKYYTEHKNIGLSKAYNSIISKIEMNDDNFLLILDDDTNITNEYINKIIENAILAGVGNSIVIETKEKNYADLKKINYIYMCIAGIATACMLNLYQPFMKLWMGDSMLLSFKIVILLCVYFFSLEMGAIRAIYSDANGLWWENRYRAILESIANIVLNYFLGKYFGLCGIILATFISLFFINFLYGSQILFKYYFTNVSVIDYFKQQGLYAIITVIICFISFYICKLIAIDGIIGLVMKLLCTMLCSMILFYIFYCKSPIFKDTKEFIINIVRK